MLEWNGCLNGCLNEMKQNVFTKSIHRKTPAKAPFLVQLQTCGLTAFPKGLHHRWFSKKIAKFYRKSFLQNTPVRLLLIFCNIFNVSSALPAINEFSHSWEIFVAVYDRRIYNCSDLKLDLYCYIYETLWN